MTVLGIADVVAHVSDAAFGRPLVTNVLRGHVAEAIVSLALGPAWRWCAADYASWDFEREDGVRLEVKQSARRQSWNAMTKARSRPSFDARPRTCWYDGLTWIDTPGRAAHLYLFCWHDRSDDGADHRDPMQWTFHVVPATALPLVDRLGLAAVRERAAPCTFEQLSGVVTRAASCLPSGQNPPVSTVSPSIVTADSASPNATSRCSA